MKDLFKGPTGGAGGMFSVVNAFNKARHSTRPHSKKGIKEQEGPTESKPIEIKITNKNESKE